MVDTQIINFTIKFNKTLGVYPPFLNKEIDEIILPAINSGFSFETLLLLAEFNKKYNKVSLELIKKQLDYFISINCAKFEQMEYFLKIKSNKRTFFNTFLKNLGYSDDRVPERYKNCIKFWKSKGLEENAILYASELAGDKEQPFNYCYNVINNWLKQNLLTLQAIKSYNATRQRNKCYVEREKVDDELEEMFEFAKEYYANQI